MVENKSLLIQQVAPNVIDEMYQVIKQINFSWNFLNK